MTRKRHGATATHCRLRRLNPREVNQVGKFGRAGKAPGEFATIHQMDCRDPSVIYTAEINNWRSQKILLKPAASTSAPAGGAR